MDRKLKPMPKANVAARLDADVIEEMARHAEIESRTQSAMMNILLREALKRRSRLNGKSGTKRKR